VKSHLRALNATKTNCSIIAHDLRSPLGGIMGISQNDGGYRYRKEDSDSLKQIFKSYASSKGHIVCLKIF
jgi:nitrogen-specific signal transduction histidine kinase